MVQPLPLFNAEGFSINKFGFVEQLRTNQTAQISCQNNLISNVVEG